MKSILIKGAAAALLATGSFSPNGAQDCLAQVTLKGDTVIYETEKNITVVVEEAENKDGFSWRSPQEIVEMGLFVDNDDYDGEDNSKSRRYVYTKPEFALTAMGGTSFLRYTDASYRGKTGLSAAVGVTGHFNMGFVALVPSVLYQYDNARHTSGRFHTSSVVVPLDLMLQTPRYSSFGGFISVGGYYRYIIDGHLNGKGIDFSRKVFRNEGGVQWGIGAWMKDWTIGVNVRYGLTDMLRNRDGVTLPTNIRTRSTHMLLRYHF